MAKAKSKSLVFTFEWILEIEPNISFSLDEVMEKMRENGCCEMINVEVREPQA